MTVSAMDTAKLPRSATRAPGARSPVTGDGPSLAVEPVGQASAPAGESLAGPAPVALASVATPVPPPPLVADRRSLRQGRRQLRRQQRRYAAAGIAVLAVVFLAAVIVLGGIR